MALLQKNVKDVEREEIVDMLGLNPLGQLVKQSGSDYATAAQGEKADQAMPADQVSLVGKTGSYLDLTDRPSIPPNQVNSDWNATTGVSQILNKPNLGSAASLNQNQIATAAQGEKADSAVQPSDLLVVEHIDNKGKPGGYASLGNDGRLPEDQSPYTIATVSEAREGLPGKLIDAQVSRASLAPLVITHSASITLDFNQGRTFTIQLQSNTNINVSNLSPGQDGIIMISQDSVGGHTINWGPEFTFSGGKPILTMSPNSVDMIAYWVETNNIIRCTFAGAFE